jgi:hypothetical protein
MSEQWDRIRPDQLKEIGEAWEAFQDEFIIFDTDERRMSLLLLVINITKPKEEIMQMVADEVDRRKKEFDDTVQRVLEMADRHGTDVDHILHSCLDEVDSDEQEGRHEEDAGRDTDVSPEA